ncbi:hypothetical protein GPALN_003775 [Globodera pallida]|nr:hypothetical protein GPALN_003775 [Globodera pallida]
MTKRVDCLEETDDFGSFLVARRAGVTVPPSPESSLAKEGSSRRVGQTHCGERSEDGVHATNGTEEPGFNV